MIFLCKWVIFRFHVNFQECESQTCPPQKNSRTSSFPNTTCTTHYIGAYIVLVTKNKPNVPSIHMLPGKKFPASIPFKPPFFFPHQNRPPKSGSISSLKSTMAFTTSGMARMELGSRWRQRPDAPWVVFREATQVVFREAKQPNSGRLNKNKLKQNLPTRKTNHQICCEKICPSTKFTLQ